MAVKRICGTCLYYQPHKPDNNQCKKCGDRPERPNWAIRQMFCTICGTEMVYLQHEFLKCTTCGSEFWPFVDREDVSETIRQEFELNLPCARSMEVSSPVIGVKTKVGGGSKSKSRGNKKQLMQKPSLAAVNNALINSKNPKPAKPYVPQAERPPRGRPKKSIDKISESSL